MLSHENLNILNYTCANYLYTIINNLKRSTSAGDKIYISVNIFTTRIIST